MDIREVLSFLSFIIPIVLALLLLCAPIMYLDGSAKSEYLASEKDINMVWYKAMFLPDTVFVDVRVSDD